MNERRKSLKPTIVRRLRKEEFERIEESEVNDYLSQLEKEYAIKFDNTVKTSLVANCRDRQSGGLGNFIEILELLFSEIRPEWEAISYQMIRDSGRIIHDHAEAIQSYTSIKPSKYDALEIESFEEIKKNRAVAIPVQSDTNEHLDVSTLEVMRVDMALMQDVLRHKVVM